jgi:hypothetical protein
MAATDAVPTIPCPSCRQPMQSHDFEQNYRGLVRIEFCLACAGIWFDHLASIQLAPGAVIELFKQIHSRAEAPRQPLARDLACPRCAGKLEVGFDLCKAGRFSYFRCLRGDGRFTPFIQFLREKQFVRTLNTAELAQVRAKVRQINCSECGAPIDLEHASECQYCHAPISFLDPDAVEKAVKMWSDVDHRRHIAPSPEAMGDAMMRLQFPRTQPAPPTNVHFGDLLLKRPGGSYGMGSALGAGVVVDLVALGIDAISGLFDR